MWGASPNSTGSSFLSFSFWKTVVVDPSNSNYFYWSMIVMFAVLYNILFIILRCVFPQPHKKDILPLWFVLDYLCDCIYLMDMFVKSRIGKYPNVIILYIPIYVYKNLKTVIVKNNNVL